MCNKEHATGEVEEGKRRTGRKGRNDKGAKLDFARNSFLARFWVTTTSFYFPLSLTGIHVSVVPMIVLLGVIRKLPQGIVSYLLFSSARRLFLARGSFHCNPLMQRLASCSSLKRNRLLDSTISKIARPGRESSLFASRQVCDAVIAVKRVVPRPRGSETVRSPTRLAKRS